MPLQPPRPAAARLRDAPGVPPSHARAPRIASYERPGAVDLARASATYVGAQGGRGRGVRRVREVPVAADVKAGGAPRLGVLFRSKECYPSDVVHDAWLRSLIDEKIRAAENWGPTPRVRIKPLR
ncbi:hypothetical protein C8J57DRAFT_1540929 [Mycena rebaudengoi]|nr:hypothetical protein C8J57DRAFT_1540929 [Mycena rebaudengoi]